MGEDCQKGLTWLLAPALKDCLGHALFALILFGAGFGMTVSGSVFVGRNQSGQPIPILYAGAVALVCIGVFLLFVAVSLCCLTSWKKKFGEKPDEQDESYGAESARYCYSASSCFGRTTVKLAEKLQCCWCFCIPLLVVGLVLTLVGFIFIGKIDNGDESTSKGSRGGFIVAGVLGLSMLSFSMFITIVRNSASENSKNNRVRPGQSNICKDVPDWQPLPPEPRPPDPSSREPPLLLSLSTPGPPLMAIPAGPAMPPSYSSVALPGYPFQRAEPTAHWLPQWSPPQPWNFVERRAVESRRSEPSAPPSELSARELEPFAAPAHPPQEALYGYNTVGISMPMAFLGQNAGGSVTPAFTAYHPPYPDPRT